MFRTTLLVLALALSGEAPGASAEDYAKNSSAPVRVRYMVSDVPAAAEFYTSKLGFKVDFSSGTYFAALSRNGLQLLLSPVKGPGGASQPMPNGERPAPGHSRPDSRSGRPHLDRAPKPGRGAATVLLQRACGTRSNAVAR